MNKPLVTCTACCAAAAAFALFHGSVADRTAPARMMPTHGTHIVAVDEHGVVLASDDDGKTWRPAPRGQVPAMLPAVAFGDARSGWAALLNH